MKMRAFGGLSCEVASRGESTGHQSKEFLHLCKSCSCCQRSEHVDELTYPTLRYSATINVEDTDPILHKVSHILTEDAEQHDRCERMLPTQHGHKLCIRVGVRIDRCCGLRFRPGRVVSNRCTMADSVTGVAREIRNWPEGCSAGTPSSLSKGFRDGVTGSLYPSFPGFQCRLFKGFLPMSS